jgi:hypothetical protein
MKRLSQASSRFTVSENGFVERLKGIFGGPDKAPSRKRRHKTVSAGLAATQAQDLRDLIGRLDEQNIADVMAGCVQLLGLDQIKERLGRQWPAVADKALLIAQTALDEHLGPGDIYRLVDDASFQICFESSDEAFASAQVKKISDAIEQKIESELGSAENTLTVRTFVAPVPSARIRDANDPLSALYANLLQIRDAVNSRAINRHSIPALRYAGALFQPLWSNQDFGGTKNRCVLDTLAGAAASKHLEEIEELEDLVGALANVDCVLFAKSIEGLHQALGDVKRATIIIPVHFQTLAHEQQEFFDIAATLPLAYRRFVLLDLVGIPTATTSRELMKALKMGRTVTDRILLQMSPDDRRMDQNVRGMAWGVSVNLGEIDSDDPRGVQELRRFAYKAAEYGLHSFAFGANTLGKATTVVEAGFDYVGGAAVANTVPIPRPHANFKPLFGDVSAKPNPADGKPGLRAHPRFAPLDPNSTVTLPSGEQHECRVPNVSASGAVILCSHIASVGDYLVLGSIPAQVVRQVDRGFAVRFLEVQEQSAIEIALHTPISGDSLLKNLRDMAA